jgi:ketosteroid isomerase-like protein
VGKMADSNSLKAHALSWIGAWNRHDLEGILSHYADNVVFQAATVARRWNRPDGILRGKTELRAHFTKGLELALDLRFDFEEMFHCPGGYAVLYRRNNGNRVIDVVELDDDQLIRNARAFYADEQR